MKQSRLAQRKLGVSHTHKIKPKKKSFWKFFLIPPFLVLLFLILFYFLSPRKWDGNSKVVIVSQLTTGEGNVVVLDPAGSSITTIKIPADVELEAANGLGTWKLRSITKLGKDKKLSDDFFKNTIIKSFSFPIDSWADENLTNLTSGNLIKSVNAIFATNSDLSIVDKVKITLFSLGVGYNGRTQVDLEKSGILTRKQLTDGSLGWEVNDVTTPKIASIFTYGNHNNLNILLNSSSSRDEAVDVFAKTIEIIGLNIASTQTSDAKVNDKCLITGTEKELITKIAGVFSCDINFIKPQNNFDIEIDLGKNSKSIF